MTHLLLYRSYKTNQSGFKLENKLNNNGATYVIIIYNIIYIYIKHFSCRNEIFDSINYMNTEITELAWIT